MGAPHVIVEIGKGALIVATVALFAWLKWRQAKRNYERDLGEGGIRTLFGCSKKR
jgi:hypothetical protein